MFIASARGFVGSVFISSYMSLSERCSMPSFRYFVVSSITIPDPLSAPLITIV